jgi:site-specific DNA-methyltransferase (adenine-specific)
MKELDGTFARNVIKHGVGGINIDTCRIPTNGEELKVGSGGLLSHVRDNKAYPRGQKKDKTAEEKGRWPANLIHDNSEEVRDCFPEAPGQQGDLKGHNKSRKSPHGCFGEMGPAVDHKKRKDMDKSAARFFYCAKVSSKDRNEGLPEGVLNQHPTVKPNNLMKYLCRLVAPPENAVILDPFMGSGSTGKAAVKEGFRFIGIERSKEDCDIAIARIKYALQHSTKQHNANSVMEEVKDPEFTIFDIN